MRDSEAIGYFIQYLETMNVTVLAKCLLDIDNFNASLSTNSYDVPWDSVKGVNKVVNESGRVSWEFCNGVGYTSNVACDISGHSPKETKGIGSASVSGRTVVRAASEAKLTEMQRMEQQVLAKLLEAEVVSEVTVDALRIFYKYFSYAAPFKILLADHVFQKFLNNFKSNIDDGTFSDVRHLIFTVLEKE